MYSCTPYIAGIGLAPYFLIQCGSMQHKAVIIPHAKFLQIAIILQLLQQRGARDPNFMLVYFCMSHYLVQPLVNRGLMSTF